MLPRRGFLGGLLVLVLSPALAQPGLAEFRQRSARLMEVPASWLDWSLAEQIWRSGVTDEAALYKAWYPHLTWKVLEWSVPPTYCGPDRPRWEDA
jgi:hypothetical protein